MAWLQKPIAGRQLITIPQDGLRTPTQQRWPRRSCRVGRRVWKL